LVRVAGRQDRPSGKVSRRTLVVRYVNQYSFWMDIRDGKICRVREYLDTLYAQQILFDPAGIKPTEH
jgi:ketosteroid isomerase-like protein